MYKRSHAIAFPYSLTTVCGSIVALLAIAYVGLIAVVMSYAALTVEFSQSVRNDEATVAALESRYLARVAEITSVDYVAAGYTKPIAQTFVSAKSGTALR
jgi:hypothetical protein